MSSGASRQLFSARPDGESLSAERASRAYLELFLAAGFVTVPAPETGLRQSDR